MRTTMLSLAAAIACLPFATGCSQSSKVVRGQGPEYGPITASAMYEEGDGDADFDCDDDDGYYCDESGRPCARGRHCRCHGGCHGCHGCCHGGCDECCFGGTPYCVPRDLAYPPPGDMPGIVQYPYYTSKGPDCFFHP